MLICRNCNTEVEYYANGKLCQSCYNTYMAFYMLARYHRRREEAIEQLGGKCTACGSTEDLEFDHIDPKTKTGDTGKLFNQGEKRLQAELLKCHLLCKKCHAAKTAQQKSVAHGGGKTGKKNCCCELCKPLKLAYARDWQAARRAREKTSNK